MGGLYADEWSNVGLRPIWPGESPLQIPVRTHVPVREETGWPAAATTDQPSREAPIPHLSV